MYSISLELSGQTYEATGETLIEALRALPKPDKIMNKGILKVSDGKKDTGDMGYNVPRLRRLFYPQFQPYAVKGLLLLLK